ncbi:MAG: PEP-CTERM sorting domain-containing protein, partial [Lacipirellulaceae bacterium]
PGVDSSVTWTISPQDGNAADAFDYDPFNSLRIGGPSGVTGNNESVVDNISLDLIDLVVGGTDNADFDGSNLVDGDDFLTLQQNFGTLDPLFVDGDANSDGAINSDDVGIFQTQYGTNPNSLASVGAVPEPTSAVLGMLIATIGLALRRRS